jgi:YD repeat-containing protein
VDEENWCPFTVGVQGDRPLATLPTTVSSSTPWRRRKNVSPTWEFDPLGNWSTLTTDGTPQARTHNRQNQITAISGQTTPAYDNNGNLTTDQTGKTLVYDAWNRLVQVKEGSTTLVTYSHDALNRRVTEDRSGTVTDLYYSAAWQVLEERVSGTTKIQYVWSPVYVDALVLRDRDANGLPGDGPRGDGLEERLYVQQDANWNVTALVDAAGNVVERYVYNPFGAVAVLTPSCRGHVCFSINGGGFVYICATVDQFFTCRRTQRIVLTILPLKAKPTS